MKTIQNNDPSEYQAVAIQLVVFSVKLKKKKICRSPWTSSVACHSIFLLNDTNLLPTLIPHLFGSHGSKWTSSWQMSQLLHFQAILQLDFRWPLTLTCDLRPHEYMKVPMLYSWTKFSSNWTSTFQMRPILHFQPILQLDLRWPLTLVCNHLISSTNEDFHIIFMIKFGWNPAKHVEDMAKC